MTWLLLSLLAPLIWSVVNHAEKVLLSRYFQNEGVGALMIVIGAIALPVAGILVVVAPRTLAVDAGAAGVLLASGLLYAVSCVTYLLALERHDASYVVPFWQLTPVFTYGLGLVFLGERLSGDRLLGGGVVILGALMLSVRPSAGRLTLDLRSIGLMAASSAALALGFVLFKLGGEGLEVSSALFWNQLGLGLISMAFVLSRANRVACAESFRRNGPFPIALNLTTQVLDLVAVVAANVAVRFAPAALVVLVEYAVQPVFVFLIGGLLSVVAPRWVDEDISLRSVAHRLAAIATMTFGVWVVLR